MTAHRDSDNNRILVTGANGFVGQGLVSALLNEGYFVHCAQRKVQNKKENRPNCEYFSIGDFTEKPKWDEALTGVDSVVHLAARVHVMQETANDPLAEFRKVNVGATLELANAAVRRGVRRFIYMSTIKVNGEQTEGRAFSEEDQLNPGDPYARSKLEAEQRLMALGRESGMEIVVIRPVLVYGPGVKGNVFRLLQLIRKGMPLPFKSVNNQRSLLGLDNLLNLIILCIHHPSAANQVFLAADGGDISTEKLVTLCANNMQLKPRLFRAPRSVCRMLATVSSRVRNLEQRLYGSLQVEISKARKRLNWQPPKTLEQGIKETVDDFLASDA